MKRSRLGVAYGAKRTADVVAVGAATFLALALNVLGGRHIRRVDVTSDRRFSLSTASVETLRELHETVTVWVLLGAGDPLEQSVKQLLRAYEAESSKIVVRTVDPDRDTAALVDLRSRFNVEAGRNEDGRIVTDAVVVVEDGKRHWFLTAEELFEQKDDSHALPREERAITGALRSLTAGEHSRLCFTEGHGELSTLPSHAGSIGELRSILEKDNYDVVGIDTTRPDAFEPFEGCAAVVVAGLSGPFSSGEANRLKSYALAGGSVLLAIGPTVDNSGFSTTNTGLDELLIPFGVKLGVGVVIDPDPHTAIANTASVAFIAVPLPHPMTAGLTPEAGGHPPSVVMNFVRPIERADQGGTSAVALLHSSDESFALRDLHEAANWRDTPEKGATDPKGPFTLAVASERPKLKSAMSHGPRLVVIGSSFALADENWKQPRSVRGAAFLVENALSWLSARNRVLDIPERQAHAAGIRMTEESMLRVRSYVLLYMPLSAVLLALLVYLVRKSGEGAPYKTEGGK